MLSEILIITNNPMVNNINDVEICFVKGNYLQVLYEVLNRVAAGHNLLSHPLAGNIEPVNSPYRSVVVSKIKGSADMVMLEKLNKWLEKIEAARKDIAAQYSPPIMADFQTIDKNLLDNAIQTLTSRAGVKVWNKSMIC